jgi:hypothetical protein
MFQCVYLYKDRISGRGMAVRSGRALGSSGPPELWANLSNFKF